MTIASPVVNIELNTLAEKLAQPHNNAFRISLEGQKADIN